MTVRKLGFRENREESQKLPKALYNATAEKKRELQGKTVLFLIFSGWKGSILLGNADLVYYVDCNPYSVFPIRWFARARDSDDYWKQVDYHRL